MLKTILFTLSCLAGGSNPQDVFKALQELSEKSIIANFFLNNPDSPLCGKGKTYTHLGQKLALATEEFKVIWAQFSPNAEQLEKIRSLSEVCLKKDGCFSLSTLIELNPKAYTNVKVPKQGEEDYSKSIKEIISVCRKIDF